MAPAGVGLRGVPAGLPVSKQVLNTTPCATVYVSNLNEKIKIDTLKDTLRDLFKPFGTIQDIVAHRNIRMRGQAFIAYKDIEMAEKAIKEMQHYVVYNKPMVVQFARNKSDVHAKEDGDFDEHKRKRDEKKGNLRLLPLPGSHKPTFKAPGSNKRKKAAAAAGGPIAGAPGGTAKQATVPDEYLPPNNILFIQNLADTITQDDLIKLFQAYPGFKEVRTIPVKKDIAFVEYDNEYQASLAKMELADHEFENGTRFKLTFARK
ncbi:hypothetical protein BC940DRAFT_235858 [Gongronella butleri]|nr:hypothetical protein BC940DRAFT_235858 [Gongronella butleri]